MPSLPHVLFGVLSVSDASKLTNIQTSPMVANAVAASSAAAAVPCCLTVALLDDGCYGDRAS